MQNRQDTSSNENYLIIAYDLNSANLHFEGRASGNSGLAKVSVQCSAVILMAIGMVKIANFLCLQKVKLCKTSNQ